MNEQNSNREYVFFTQAGETMVTAEHIKNVIRMGFVEVLPKEWSDKAIVEIARLQDMESRAKRAEEEYGLLHAAEAIQYILYGGE